MKLTPQAYARVRDGRDQVAAEVRLLEAGGRSDNAYQLPTLHLLLSRLDEAIREYRAHLN